MDKLLTLVVALICFSIVIVCDLILQKVSKVFTTHNILRMGISYFLGIGAFLLAVRFIF